jgi:hypothetical protein
MKNVLVETSIDMAISVLATVLTFVFFNIVTDDYAFFMGALAAKQFSDFAYFDVHFQGFMGVREIFRLFYFLMPQINWHLIYAILFEVFGLFLLLRAIRTIILKNTSEFSVKLMQLFFALIYIENITFISHTRVSLIFCGIALFNLAFTKQLSRKSIILNGLLFLLGLLLRSESSMATVLIISAGFLIYNFNPIALAKRIWLPVLTLSIFLSIFFFDLANTNVFVRKVEPEIEYKMMAKRVVDISEMKTAKDSVKYEAALVGMWFDMKEMSPEFMRSMILQGADFSSKHMKSVYSHVMKFYHYYVFIGYTIMALILLSFLMLEDRKTIVLKMTLFTLAVFLIIYAIDYNGFLVSNRHFLSMQIISLMVLCFYFFDAQRKNLSYNKLIVTSILLFIFIGVGKTVLNYKQQSKSLDNQITLMANTMKEFERRYTNRIVAVTIDSRFLFDNHFTIFNANYTKNTYLMFDWFTFPLTPRYVDYLSRKCNCDANDPVVFYKWLATNNALYFSVPSRYDLTARYMKNVHNLDVEFVDPIKLNSLRNINNGQTDDCEIRRVKITTH